MTADDGRRGAPRDAALPGMQQDVVGIAAALEGVVEHWSPKVVGRVDDQ